MFKLISAKMAARKSIKKTLEKEIPLINEAIEKAIANGKAEANYEGEISRPTVKLLTKAGYVVENWDIWNATTKILWYEQYNKISESEAEVETLAKEDGVEVTKIQ